MTVVELAELVERMRALQRRFFKGERSPELVAECKPLERAVDRATRDILHPPAPTLFDRTDSFGADGGML